MERLCGSEYEENIMTCVWNVVKAIVSYANLKLETRELLSSDNGRQGPKAAIATGLSLEADYASVNLEMTITSP